MPDLDLENLSNEIDQINSEPVEPEELEDLEPDESEEPQDPEPTTNYHKQFKLYCKNCGEPWIVKVLGKTDAKIMRLATTCTNCGIYMTVQQFIYPEELKKVLPKRVGDPYLLGTSQD